jgi:Mor family transcriptional regulator
MARGAQNAKDILPADLFKRCQQYAGGRTIYVHAPRPGNTQRRKVRIRVLAGMGMAKAQIARQVKCGERYVYRVLQQSRC